MKLALILLTIALVAHIAMAGVLGRPKRDADDDGDVNVDIEVGWKVLKNLVKRSGTIVTKTLEKIPDTDAYAKYRGQLESYLKDYNEYTSKQGPCFSKTKALFEKFQAFTAEWSEDDAATEAKEVDKLLGEVVVEVYGDEGKELANQYEDLAKNPKQFDENEQLVKTLALFFEVC